MFRYGDCPETTREHTTRGFRGKVSLTHKKERALVRARAPDSEGRPARTRGARLSRSSLPFVHTRAPRRAVRRVAADPRCVPCFAPSFPESTGGSACARLVLFTQSHRVVQTPSGRSRTQTHAALQLTAAAPLQRERSSSSSEGLTTNTLAHVDSTPSTPNFLLFDEE